MPEAGLEVLAVLLEVVRSKPVKGKCMATQQIAKNPNIDMRSQEICPYHYQEDHHNT